MIDVTIVDETNVYSEGIQLILNKEAGIRVGGIFSESAAFLKHAESSPPDIILFNTERMSAAMREHVHSYCSRNKQVKLVYLTSGKQEIHFYDWLKEPPNAVLVESIAPDQFIRALFNIHQGQYVLSGKIAAELMTGMQQVELLQKLILKEKLVKLDIVVSKQELDLLYLLFRKQSLEQVAEEVQIPVPEIRQQFRGLFKKLQVKSREEASRRLIRLMCE